MEDAHTFRGEGLLHAFPNFARRLALVLIAVALAPPCPAADPPKGKLAELVKLYQAYELPLPPKDAKLYRYAVPAKEGKRPPPPPRIGFGLNPGKDGVPTLFLDGWREERFSPDFTTEIPPDPKQVPVDEISLETIVQIHLRGWTDLAEESLPKWKGWKVQTPEQALAYPAWKYWLNKLHDPKVDRALIVRRMASAMQACPEAFRDKESEMLFVDLRWSLMPSRAKPGTVEAMIDEWLDISQSISFVPDDERYEAVVRQGFDAIPALIDALSDTRLTRAWRTTFAPLGSGPIHCRVRDFAADTLRGFMYDGEPFAEKEGGDGLDVKKVKKWWARASKVSEEEYVVNRALRVEKDAIGPNEHLLMVVRHKYPNRLPALFRHVLTDRPDMDLDSLATAVATSSLPKETKRELLLEAIGSKGLYRRRAGRQYLWEVDPERFNQVVIDSLAKLPASPNEPYHVCEEAAFAQDVLRTTDAKVWDAAEKYVRRADAGTRLEWLKAMLYPHLSPEPLRMRVEFVAKFLTDETVRDATADPKMYPGGYAGYPDFPVIEVRNYAAFALSYLLEVKAKPSPKWTADEWAKFRDEVAKAAKAGK